MALTYRDAGVDIDRGNALVRRIGPLAARTHRPEVRAGVGGFGALFAIPPGRYHAPVLVSGTDGVGTKLRLAIDHDRLEGVGVDLVAMCANDILTLGAEPLFFLDYYATGRLDEHQATQVISGIVDGCLAAGAALIGGETAEMPGMYAPGDLDLAGFCVGIVEADAVVDGRAARAGDAVIGIASSGLHSNGYSLARAVLDRDPLAATRDIDGRPLLDVLMSPTCIYAGVVRALLASGPVHAMAHITGGGLPENLPRAFPETLRATLVRSSWPEPAVFDWLARTGDVSREEMDRAFNCGIGYAVIVPDSHADAAVVLCAQHGLDAYRIGTLERRPDDADGVAYV